MDGVVFVVKSLMLVERLFICYSDLHDQAELKAYHGPHMRFLVYLRISNNRNLRYVESKGLK